MGRCECYGDIEGEVQMCDLHRAAPSLLDAADHACALLNGMELDGDGLAVRDMLAEAITEATGKPDYEPADHELRDE